jgi:ATP-dependent Lon protease
VTVLIPRENERDLKEIPAKVKRGLKIVLVEHMDEVLQKALVLDDPRSFDEPMEYALEEILQETSAPTAEAPAGVN